MAQSTLQLEKDLLVIIISFAGVRTQSPVFLMNKGRAYLKVKSNFKLYCYSTRLADDGRFRGCLSGVFMCKISSVHFFYGQNSWRQIQLTHFFSPKRKLPVRLQFLLTIESKIETHGLGLREAHVNSLCWS